MLYLTCSTSGFFDVRHRNDNTIHLFYYNINNILSVDSPSCLHVAVASSISQLSSQTVPHLPLTQTSTRPSKVSAPSISRTFPLTHVPIN